MACKFLFLSGNLHLEFLLFFLIQLLVFLSVILIPSIAFSIALCVFAILSIFALVNIYIWLQYVIIGRIDWSNTRFLRYCGSSGILKIYFNFPKPTMPIWSFWLIGFLHCVSVLLPDICIIDNLQSVTFSSYESIFFGDFIAFLFWMFIHSPSLTPWFVCPQ